MASRSDQRSNMTPREFAVLVVRRLRKAGYDAYFAGGCVRDELMQRTPKDYDVATNAVPEAVRKVFGKRRTLTVGAAFGVVLVVGPPSAGAVHVATFRRDTTYSDGRRPDAVIFSSAREDALRRDFTINGLFYDPIADQVIDFVGGMQDIQRKIVRAIGDAEQRIAEDKLRMLRAIRFATTFGFDIDVECWHSIRRHAAEIVQVSQERITAEFRRILEHTERARGVRLLYESGLLAHIFPQGVDAYGLQRPEGPSAHWEETLAILQALGPQDDATLALAVLLRYVCGKQGTSSTSVADIGKAWRLSSKEIELIALALLHESLLLEAHRRPWPQVQRVLALPDAARLVDYVAAISQVVNMGQDAVALCRHTLARDRSQWDPPPLISGEDLKALGLRPGPVYRRILDAVRDAQLEGRVHSHTAAVEFARQLSSSFQLQTKSTDQ